MNLKQLYDLSLIEKEGLGTAYEYFVKLRFIRHKLKQQKIKSVLIYGLPEKYGFSLDFLLFSQSLGIVPDVLEIRKNKLNKLENIILETNGHLGVSLKYNVITRINHKYDLILSCEVLQRFNQLNQKKFISRLKSFANNYFIFVPNRHNDAHFQISGLNGFFVKNVEQLVGSKYSLTFIDAPPFPPGIRAKKKITSSLFISILELYAYFEPFFPKVIKKRMSHIICVYKT